MQITAETKINDLINGHPDVIPVLMSYGLNCVGCSYAANDTLSSGAKLHGFDGEKMQMLLRDVNKILSKENATNKS